MEKVKRLEDRLNEIREKLAKRQVGLDTGITVLASTEFMDGIPGPQMHRSLGPVRERWEDAVVDAEFLTGIGEDLRFIFREYELAIERENKLILELEKKSASEAELVNRISVPMPQPEGGHPGEPVSDPLVTKALDFITHISEMVAFAYSDGVALIDLTDDLERAVRSRIDRHTLAETRFLFDLHGILIGPLDEGTLIDRDVYYPKLLEAAQASIDLIPDAETVDDLKIELGEIELGLKDPTITSDARTIMMQRRGSILWFLGLEIVNPALPGTPTTVNIGVTDKPAAGVPNTIQSGPADPFDAHPTDSDSRGDGETGSTGEDSGSAVEGVL